MNMRRTASTLALFSLLSAVPAFPQGERGTITGTVTDTTGGIVTGASVTLRNVGTNIKTTATSNAAGLYVFPALTPGAYDISVEHAGFKTKRVTNIPLATGTTVTIDAQLDVGAVTESVQVEASAVQLEVQTSGLSKVVESRKVVELPILGRNPLNLASTAPGVIPTSAQGGDGAGAIGSATNSRISGGLAMQNAVLMDGGESRGFTSGGQAYSVPIESVEEFKVETATYSAEYGHSGGGVVNVATKSGTNQYHGVVYEFLRNDHLNANGWSNNRNRLNRALFQSNTFGAAAGGRIKRDHTFFFLNYEGVRAGTPDQFLSTVPTADQKAGNFSSTLDPQGRQTIVYDYLTTRPDPVNAGKFIRDAFAGNRIPADRIHPISKNVLNFWPAPNRAGEGPVGVRNYLLSGKNVNQADIWFARIDHQLSNKHRLFGRTGGSQNDSYSTLAEKAFPARAINSNPTRTGLVSLTSTWTQNLLGEGRFSYTRLQFNSFPVSEGFDMASLGFSQKVVENVLYKQFPQITVQQYNSGSGLVVSTFGADEVGQLGGATKTLAPQDNWHAQYHFTWIKGSHKFKFGTDHQLLRMNAYNSQFSAGQYFFDRTYVQGPDPSVSAANSGHGFASLLLGVPQAGTLTFTPRMFLFQRYKSGYFQDDWRVNSRLTLNLGLRYEYTSPYGEKWGNIGYIDPYDTEPVTGGKGVFKWVKPGGYHTDPNYKTFGPRVGLAYRVNSKTVIRSAGALFYAANNGLNAAATDFGSGTFVTNFITLGEQKIPFTPPQGGSWTDPFAGGFTYPQKGVTTFAGQNIRVDVKNHPLAYLTNWNFSIQREVSPTMIAEVAYVGNKITHLFWNRQDNANDPLLLSQWGTKLNDVVPNPYFGKVTVGALSFPTVQRKQLLRPFPQYQDVLHIRANYGDSNYQSMTARFEKRYSQGLTVSVGYTLSKTISDIGGDSNTWVVGPSNALYNVAYNRGLEANDLPHRIVISHLYDLPFGKGRRWANTNGLANFVLGGWQWNGITIFQSGRPILITGPDVTNLFNFQYTNGRADRLKSGVLSSGQTLDHWFDTTAFARAQPFTVPTDSLTQPNLRGPGRKSLDMSLFKNTRFKERYNVQFRVEAFNLTNSPFFEARGSTTDVTNQDFGRITSGRSPRNVQLGIRVLF